VANWPFNEITGTEQPDAIKCYPHLLCDIAISFTLYKKEAAGAGQSVASMRDMSVLFSAKREMRCSSKVIAVA
jgi:hypothetical protein